jgi:hypothetical protein
MKKLLAIITFMAISTYCHSQTFKKVFKSIYSEYKNNEWVDQLVNYPDALYLILNGNEITINNQTEAKYVTYGDVRRTYYPTHTASFWNALDKNGRSCTILMKTSENSNSISLSILYYGYCYEYITE